MTVASVTILSLPDGFDTYDLRPAIDMAWTGGVGPFDVRYEWDDNVGFASPIIVTNVGVVSPDSAVPTADMGPAGTDWYFRVTVIDNNDAGEVQEPLASYRTLNFQNADDDFRYLHVNHNVGVGFGVDPFDSLPLGDGDPDLLPRYLHVNHNIGAGFGTDDFDNLPLGDGDAQDFFRYLYLNHNIDATQPCPWLQSISPSLQAQGGTITLFGLSFGALQSTYATQIRLYETQDLLGGSYSIMSPTSWANDEVTVTVPSGAATGWVAVVHTNLGASCDGSAFKLLNVELTAANPDMGWWLETVDKENAVTADSTIIPYNVTGASFTKIMNSVGSGMIEIPLSDPDIDSIIDPIMRKGVLIRCYLDDRFRYAFYSEVLSHGLNEEGVEVARITGRGMEVVALWSRILPHDHPASPTKSPTWVYGSNENFIRNAGFDDVINNPILSNPGGEEGNVDGEDGNADGVAIGWNGTGNGLTYFRAVKDSLAARSDDWYLKVATSATRSGMSQSFTVTPGRVYHVWGYVKEPTAAGQRVLMSLGGADDIKAFNSTYPNNFNDDGRVYAELDNAAQGAGASDGTWQRLDVEVTTGAEQTSLDVAFENFDTSIFVPFYVDDVEPVGWGLGLDPWVVYDAPLHAVDSFSFSPTQTRDSSAYSLYIDVGNHDPLIAGPGFQQKISVNPNTKYTLTGWVYPTGTPENWALAIVADDNLLIRDFTALVPVADQWNEIRLVYTTADDEDEIFVRMTYEGPTITDPSGAFFDSFSLIPGEESAFAGKIANDVLDKMALVGKLTFLQRTFTDTVDSAGVPFPRLLSLDINPQESLFGLLSRFVALGHEWEIVPTNFVAGGDTGFELNLYTARAFNPDSGVGQSHISDTSGPVIMPGDATFAGRIVKTAFNVNTVFALGEGGVWSQVEQFPYETSDIPAGDPAPLGYKASFGIIEDVISVNAVDTETIAQYGDARMTEEKAKERAIQVNMQRASDIRPFLHFGVGDSMFVDMPPHNADEPDPTTGLRSNPKRIRAIQAELAGEGSDVTFVIDIDRVIYEDELAWLALVAQLAERSPSENTSQGTGKVSGESGVSNAGTSGSGTIVASNTTTVEPGPHTHDLTSTDITKKAALGDISGTLPGPLTVNKVKGKPVSGTIPAITRALDPHRVVWIFDRSLAQWVPTELTDRDEDFYNGTFAELFTAAITEAAGVVTMSLEKTGGGQLTMRFSDGHIQLDTTPALTIALTAGSDTSPTTNYVYIPQSTKVLTKSTTGFPTAIEHIKVAFFLVPSATFVASNGAYIHQQWNDENVHDDGQGHMSKITERLRRSQAIWFSGLSGAGVDDYLTIVGGTVDLKIASGVGYQLHRHDIAAFDTSASDMVLVKNWFGDAYHDVTNLFDIVADSTGTAIGNNKYFNLVVWAVLNSNGYSPVVINLPSGSYTSQVDAENDVDGMDDFTIPREFDIDSSVGLLVCRLTIQNKNTTWLYKSTTDLRGTHPQTASGGAGGAATKFADNQFAVFDEADVTKILNLDLGTVATGTTRTLIVPDANGTIALEGAATDADAIHDNVGGEIVLITEKVSPVGADLIIIEDSAAANAKKRIQISNLPGGGGTDTNAIHDNVASEISAITLKGTPVAGDFLLIEDSAAANAKKRITVSSLPSGGGGGGTSWTPADAVPTTANAANEEMTGPLDAAWIWQASSGIPTQQTLGEWPSVAPTVPEYNVNSDIPGTLVMRPLNGQRLKVYRPWPIVGTSGCVVVKIRVAHTTGSDDRVNVALERDVPTASKDEPTRGPLVQLRANGSAGRDIRVYRFNGGGATGTVVTNTMHASVLYIGFTSFTDNSIQVWWSEDGVGWHRAVKFSAEDINGNIGYIFISAYDSNTSDGVPVVGIVDWVRFVDGSTNMWKVFL